jgi:predicted DCC family thiol-disulfide oxidoreductase YuxK
MSAATEPAAPPGTGKAVVLYDGGCPLCRRSVRLLKRLDWLKRLHYQDCRDIANLPPSAVPLDPKRLLEEMHLVTPDRKRVLTGFAAFRWIAWRLPLAWPVAPLLYLPGVPWLGRRLYLWVARNRYDLVPCKDGACEVRPPANHEKPGEKK